MSTLQRVTLALAVLQFHVFSQSLPPSNNSLSQGTSFGLVLSGGGEMDQNVLPWISNKLGNGDVVVLRAGPKEEAANAWSAFRRAHPVHQEVTATPEASRNTALLNTIRQAQAVLLTGADVAVMARAWKFTPVAESLDFVAGRQSVIAGLEDAASLLGSAVFTARHGDLSSEQALSNPFDTRITLETGFFTMPYMGQVIVESHFSGFQRMGRMLTFLARLLEDQTFTEARGIGLDEGCSLLIDQTGKAVISGSGNAYFFRAKEKAEICQVGMPLSFRNVEVYRLRKEQVFDLQRWNGKGMLPYQVSAIEGKLMSTQRNKALY